MASRGRINDLLQCSEMVGNKFSSGKRVRGNMSLSIVLKLEQSEYLSKLRAIILLNGVKPPSILDATKRERTECRPSL